METADTAHAIMTDTVSHGKALPAQTAITTITVTMETAVTIAVAIWGNAGLIQHAIHAITADTTIRVLQHALTRIRM
jgi:hypothetical protein